MNKQTGGANSKFKPEPNKNSRILARLWPGFVNVEKRMKSYSLFFKEHFENAGCKNILLSAGGSTREIEWFIRNGFVPTYNEIDIEFFRLTVAEEKTKGLQFDATRHYWQELSKYFAAGTFDGIVNDGNSLSCEENEGNRFRALEEFNKLLPPGGMLIIDQRNFEYILRERKAILSGDFHYSGKFIYCGDSVHGRPIEISNRMTQWEYFADGKPERGYLAMYPLKNGELPGLLFEANFSQVKMFSDFKPGYNPNADFFIFVAIK